MLRGMEVQVLFAATFCDFMRCMKLLWATENGAQACFRTRDGFRDGSGKREVVARVPFSFFKSPIAIPTIRDIGTKKFSLGAFWFAFRFPIR